MAKDNFFPPKNTWVVGMMCMADLKLFKINDLIPCDFQNPKCYFCMENVFLKHV